MPASIKVSTTNGLPPNSPEPNRTPRRFAMLDPEFDTPDKTESRRHVFALRIRRLSGLVCIALAILWSLGFSPYSRRPFTCAVCRANTLDNNFLGLRWSSQEDTDCSRWYSENVERFHTHAWIGCTYCRRFGISGLGGGYACFVGGPLTGLSKKVQMTIYQHFEDPLEAKRLFIHLGQPDAEGNRLWESLMGWVDQDCPGTWHDWCEQQSATRK